MDRKHKAFLAIAETGNLTHAARRLNVAQPALSKTLQKLEEEVEAQLFDRHPRGLTLTSAGKEFMLFCRNSERQYRYTREAIGAITHGHLDIFRVGAGPLYHMTMVPIVFAILLKEFPETQLRLTPGINKLLVPMLLEGDLDIVLGRTNWKEDASDLTIFPLMDVETGIALRPDHPLASIPASKLTPTVLASQKWISYQHNELSNDYLQDYLSLGTANSPEIILQTGSYTTGLDLVARGDYLMAVPLQLEPVIKKSGLVLKRFRQPIARYQSGILMRSPSEKFPIVRRFIELMREQTSS